MENVNHPPEQKIFGIFPAFPERDHLWYRELFLLFYFGMLAATVLNRLFSGSQAAFLLMKGAEFIYAPGMIFAAGCLMGAENPAREDFRKRTLRKALYAILLFYGIGFLNEIIINHRAVFATVKDLLAVLRIPDTAAIFLTLCVLFLLCAFCWPWIEKCLKAPLLLAAVCLAGFLFSFLPEGLLGYGVIGVFTGSDRLGAVPLFPYLFVFFAGILTARNFSDMRIPETDAAGMNRNGRHASLPEIFTVCKPLIPVTAIALAAGAVLAVLHLKHPAALLLGSGCACICLFISAVLLPVYRILEDFFFGLLRRADRFRLSVRRRRESSRPLDIFLYYVGYCVLFLIMAYLIFVPYSEAGRTLIWSVDGLGQYVPKVHRFLSYIPSIFQDILQGNFDFQQYDFTSGLGATVAISYDPIYWLYLLFHPSQVETAYSLLIVLRYFLAGASMSALVLYFKRSHYAAYTASMVYAFSGYAIYAGTRHGQFLTPLILLPILVIAMEQLISKKKWYLLTVFTALSLLCSYYFLYMNTIALGIYFVTRILCTKEYRNFRTFFTRGLIIVGSYVLGAAMGIISIFTSFGSYMGSSRTGGSALSDFLSTTPLFYRKEWISDFFISFISDSFTPGMWLKLGFAPLALLALVLLFTRKNKKELKPIFIIFTFFCLFPIFGYIFSGFSSVTNRWCYIYAAIIAFILAENLEHLTRLTAKEIKIMLGIVCLYAGIIFFSTKYRTDKVFGVFGLLALTTALILAINHDRLTIPKRTARSTVFAVTMLAVVLNANMFITSASEDGTHLDTYVESGKSMTDMSMTALKYLDQVETSGDAGNDSAGTKTGTENDTSGADDGFYRSTNLKTYGDTRSSSLIYGYNDISTFTSTLNGGIVDYNRAMGNCDWNIVSIYSYNARTYMHELASVRYLGTSDDVKIPLPYGYKNVYDKETKKRTYSIYENQYTLPLGYTYDTVTNESDAGNLSAAEKQELTMLSAIVEDDAMADNQNLTEADSSSLPLTARKLPIRKIKASDGVTVKDGVITIPEGGGTIRFTFDGEPNSETYLSLKGDLYFPKDAAEHFLPTQVKAKDISYQYRFRIDSYSTNQEEYLFNLGYHEDSISQCTLKFKDEGTIHFDEFAIYSQSMDTYPQRAEALREHSLENVKVDTNTVTGDITVDTDQMLVISLPYQSGWTAWVDGEKTDIQKVNYQYMGLNLTPGTHSIRLHYQLPGLHYAFLITAGGAGVFVLIILFNFFRKRRRRKMAE